MVSNIRGKSLEGKDSLRELVFLILVFLELDFISLLIYSDDVKVNYFKVSYCITSIGHLCSFKSEMLIYFILVDV